MRALALALLGACAAKEPKLDAAAPPSPVASVAPAPAAAAPEPVDAGEPDAALVRISRQHGCGEPSKADRSSVATSQCLIRGNHAFVFGIVVPLGDGTFLDLGLYGGGATVEAPTTTGAKTRVKVTEPLELEGSVIYDRYHLALMHTQGGNVHPTLKLAPGQPLSGVADGDHFRARVVFDIHFGVGPIELPCSAVGLGDYNEFNTTDPKPEKNKLVVPKGLPELQGESPDSLKIAASPRTGILHASWENGPPLVKASPDATDGVRLVDVLEWSPGKGLFASGTFEVMERRKGHFKIRARTIGGTELTGWVNEEALTMQAGGRGEGIGLCGCGHQIAPRGHSQMTIAKGARIHASPDGTAWARVPTDLRAWIDPADGEWRKVSSIDRFSEGGGACPSERLEHAWVRAGDLKP